MAAPQAPPFGIILSSRPVETTPNVLSPTQYAYVVPSTPPFSHLVVFIMPGTTLPADTLAGVYIQLPGSAPKFKFLGVLANDKQSAIFRVSGSSVNGQVNANGGNEDEMTDVDASINEASSITVGISIEPTASVQTQLATLQNSGPASNAQVLSPKAIQVTTHTTKVLAQRIIQNAFNFLASFAGNTVGGEEMVPLKSFKAWWEKFERRVEADPGFLEREEHT